MSSSLALFLGLRRTSKREKTKVVALSNLTSRGQPRNVIVGSKRVTHFLPLRLAPSFRSYNNVPARAPSIFPSLFHHLSLSCPLHRNEPQPRQELLGNHAVQSNERASERKTESERKQERTKRRVLKEKERRRERGGIKIRQRFSEPAYAGENEGERERTRRTRER